MAYGPGLSKTESYVAMWSYQNGVGKYDWGNMSVRGDMSLEQVRDDPLKAQANMIPEKNVWTSVQNKIKGKRNIL